MSYLDRLAIAFLLAASAAAAEPIAPPSGLESFVLADGRELVGSYDPATGMLRLAGAVPAAIRIVPEEIASRRPALAADLPDDRPATPIEREARARAAAKGALAASERASAERATMLVLARRRQAEAEARAAAGAAAVAALDAILAAIAAERREAQGQRDHIANQRALTDLRITTISASSGVGPGHPTVAVHELTAELIAADRRLAELDARLAACDRRRAAVEVQRAARLGEERAALAAAADQAARIAALTARQELAIGERERIASVLAGGPDVAPAP